MLNANDLNGAKALLAEQRDWETNPEWIYLRGMLAWQRGWLDEATSCVKQASAMMPGNAEYKTSLHQIQWQPMEIAKKKETWQEACCGCAGECFCEAICASLCEGFAD